METLEQTATDITEESGVPLKGKRTGKRKVYEDALLDLLGYGSSQKSADDVFYGFFASQMNMKSLPDDYPHAIGVRPTLAGIEIGVNLRKFEDNYTPDERRALIKHEVLHVVHNHPIRYEERDQRILAVASDLSINQYIEGLPADAVTLDFMRQIFPKVQWPEKESMENYYSIIKQAIEEQQGEGEGEGEGGKGKGQKGDQNGDQQSGGQQESDQDGEGQDEQDNQNGGGQGNSDLPPEMDDHSGWGGEGMSDSEKEAAKAACEALIPEMAAEAEKRAVAFGAGNISADLLRAIEILNRKKRVNWKKLLRMQLSFEQRVQRFFTNKRTNRRWPKRLDIPGVRKIGGVNAAAILDVSGSMDDRSIASVCNELEGLCKQFSAELQMVQVDTEVKSISRFTQREKTIKRAGQGGTILYPAVDYLRKNNIKHDVLIVLTDGALYEEMWPEPPTCKTIFLVVGGENARLTLDTSNFKTPPVVILVPENEL